MGDPRIALLRLAEAAQRAADAGQYSKLTLDEHMRLSVAIMDAGAALGLLDTRKSLASDVMAFRSRLVCGSYTLEASAPPSSQEAPADGLEAAFADPAGAVRRVEAVREFLGAPAAEPGPMTGEDSARLLAGLPAADPGALCACGHPWHNHTAEGCVAWGPPPLNMCGCAAAPAARGLDDAGRGTP